MSKNNNIFDELLVVVNPNSTHNKDMLNALQKVLSTGINYNLFQDIGKTPEPIFYATIKMLLLCNGCILDVSPNVDNVFCDPMIQFGIAYAFGKDILLVSVSDNDINNKKLQVSMVGGHLQLCYEQYIHLAKDSRITEWVKGQKQQLNNRTTSKPRKIKSFFVFGTTKKDDVGNCISEFGDSKNYKTMFDNSSIANWELNFVMEQMADRAFCVFCFNKENNINTLVSLGLAIGMAIPFIVIHSKEEQLPQILTGYSAIIDYDGISGENGLKEKLSLYKDNFLDSEISQWKGSTFRVLSGFGEYQTQIAKSTTELEEIARMYKAIKICANQSIPDPCAGLGDLLLTWYYNFKRHDIQLLHLAKKEYEEGQKIEINSIRCRNGIEVANRQIELLDLLHNKRYKSMPGLIYLIGEDLTLSQYEQMRNFFFQIIEDLIKEQDYVHALTLLSAMQIHDKSIQIEDYIKTILNKNGDAYRLALIDAQRYILELELYQQKSANDKSLLEQIAQLRKQESDNLKREKDELSEKWRRDVENYLEAQNELKRQLDIITQENIRFKGQKADAENSLGHAVMVKFDQSSWGVYVGLNGEATIERKGRVFGAKVGMVLEYGDVVHHSGESFIIRIG